LPVENLPANDIEDMALQTSATQLTPLQSTYSVIKIDIDSVIQQLLAVKDTPGKQVHDYFVLLLSAS